MHSARLNNSDRQIQVGDLVVVVKPSHCCSKGKAVGEIFIVQSILLKTGWCDFCGKEINSLATAKPNGYWVELNRLKRIPPLSELESINTQEKVEA